MTTTIFKRRMGALLAACFGAAASVQAAPVGPQVSTGQATFAQQGNVFSITNTPGTIINWQSFNVGAGEVTRFVQQGADSAVLNRVLGQDPSKILGALQSNGKVFLINPNGILFGQGARVDVNGLVASTLDIADADFLAGKKNFKAGAQAGAVRNDGAITTPSGGRVFLVAPDVQNTGIITAPGGEVVLAAGRSVQLVDAADPDLRVVVSAPADQALNLGQVIARGGRIGIYGALVAQRGLVSADSAVRGADGAITLKASRTATLGPGSITRAVGAVDGTKGGDVHVLADTVDVQDGALVDASGRAGGGNVLLGGDWQGGGALPHARQTTLASGAVVRADATAAGSGGKVVLWSDGRTAASGSISARGRGRVETSGHGLQVDGIRVDTGGGTWLLDPYDIVVTTAGGGSESETHVSPATLTANPNTDVVLQAQNNVTIDAALNAARNVRVEAGNDIGVNAQVSSSGGDLSFSARGTFALGAGGALKSNDNIDIQANRMFLAGTVGTAGGQKPVLTLAPYASRHDIVIGEGPVSETPSESPPFSADAPLELNAANLGRLSQGVFELNVGNATHTGLLQTLAPLTASSNVVLETGGSIDIGAGIDLSPNANSRFVAALHGNGGQIYFGARITAGKSILLQGDRMVADTRFVEGPPGERAVGVLLKVLNGGVTLMPGNPGTGIAVGGEAGEGDLAIGQDFLHSVEAGSLTIGGLAGATGGLTVNGTVDFTGPYALSKLTLDAGAGRLRIDAPVMLPVPVPDVTSASGTLSLKSLGAVEATEAGAITADQLAVRAGTHAQFEASNDIGTLALANTGGGANSVRFANGRALSIGSVDGVNGVTSAGRVVLGAAGIGGSGVVRGTSLYLASSAGIGTPNAPLRTATAALEARNDGAGSAPINIANQGMLDLRAASQQGEGNTGGIAIDSVGGMTTTGLVRTGSGNITLSTHSPLTINGDVSTDSGNVSLTAGDNGAFTIGGGAHVTTISGNVSIVAGSTNIPAGAISTPPGGLSVTTGTGTGPDPGTGPVTVPPPTLDACVANRNGAGCGDVIAKAVQSCVADINAARCGDVLPSQAVCQAQPATAGCSAVAVRTQIDQCAANPALPGCAAALPTYDTCAAKPSNYGCAAVIGRHDAVAACIANPAAPGCAATLPSYAACAAAPATFGCAPVLQQHDAVTACIANTQAPGCAQVLPTLAQCRLDAGAYGCAAVLARAQFDACLANPAGAGCGAVLPTLESCRKAPAGEGCAQVLELGFQSCLQRPNDASCGGILPTLSQCVNDRTARGCDAVLPTLDQCIGSPSLQGCQVRLPALPACVQAPSTPGCQAVLPNADYCASHPGDVNCVVFTGNGGASGKEGGGAPVNQAIQQTVHLTDMGTGQVVQAGRPPLAPPGQDNASPEGADRRRGGAPGPAQNQNTGAKNDKPTTKNYCN